MLARKMKFFQLITCSSISFLSVRASNSLVSPDTLKRIDIKVVLSDMDGTLLNKQHKVSDHSINTLTHLKRQEKYLFFPATGRTRKSMADVTGQKFIELFGNDIYSVPGVYSQGLTVYGRDGKLIYERFLENNVLSMAEDFCTRKDIVVLAYAGDRIFCQSRSPRVLKVCEYGDGEPEEYSAGLKNLFKDGIAVNKLIMLGEDERLSEVRPEAEELLKGKAALTTSVPGMLEILPFGASKGEGVRILLDHLSVAPEHCMAFGDGENDIEMLKYVGLGIAMENGRPELKKIADALTLANDQDGVAYVINMLLGETATSATTTTDALCSTAPSS